MTMSTRESMRRELKELAKLAETMGKDAPVEVETDDAVAVEFPAAGLQRPITPASASRVSVAPFATPMTPPVFDSPFEAKAAPKRTGLIAVLVGAGLAIALVGGAAVGKTMADRSSTAQADGHAAAAAIAPPPADPTPATPPAAAAPAPATPDPTPAPVAAAPVAAKPTTAPAAAAAANPVRKAHWVKPVAAAPKAAAAAPASGSDSDGIAASAPAAKPAAAPKAAKPAAVSASSGGGDSLEDLIRKEVAAHK
jgi:hypothetical protein